MPKHTAKTNPPVYLEGQVTAVFNAQALGNKEEQHIEQATSSTMDEDFSSDALSFLLDDSEQVAALMALLDDPEPVNKIIALVNDEASQLERSDLR